MKELDAAHVKSTLYHSQSQSSLECFHQTMKTMLRTFCGTHGRDWERGIPLLLFSVRSVPQESLGYNPFQSACGNDFREPIQLLKEKLMDTLGN